MKFVKRIIKTRYMKKVINEVLENLAKRRPLFWSEADFQFEFAWELHKKLGDDANI